MLPRSPSEGEHTAAYRPSQTITSLSLQAKVVRAFAKKRMKKPREIKAVPLFGVAGRSMTVQQMIASLPVSVGTLTLESLSLGAIHL